MKKKKIKSMKKDLESENLQINGLESRLGQLENIYQLQRKEHQKRMKELEQNIKCSTIKRSTNQHVNPWTSQDLVTCVINI